MLTVVFLLTISSSPSRPDALPSIIDPQAKRVLETMVRAYRDAGRLEQETTYHRDDPNSPGMVRSRLIAQKPNRLFLEVIQKSADRAEPLLSRFVSDGKSFYAYQQKNGWYTKEKPPKDLKGFDFLALSVEMAALTGNDPVQGLLAKARSVRLGGPETIDGGEADVVEVDTSSAVDHAELRLFVSREDHFLRRFAFESRPIPAPANPSAPPLEPGESIAAPPSPVSMSYDVHVMKGREQAKDPFTWVAPPGSFAYQQFPTVLDPKGGKLIAPNPQASMPPGVTPMKVISIQELMKNAKKPNGKKK